MDEKTLSLTLSAVGTAAILASGAYLWWGVGPAVFSLETQGTNIETSLGSIDARLGTMESDIKTLLGDVGELQGIHKATAGSVEFPPVMAANLVDWDSTPLIVPTKDGELVLLRLGFEAFSFQGSRFAHDFRLAPGYAIAVKSENATQKPTFFEVPPIEMIDGRRGHYRLWVISNNPQEFTEYLGTGQELPPIVIGTG